MTKAFMEMAEAANATRIKILKINLTTDSFEVLKEDKLVEAGLSHEVTKISAYLEEFARRGLIHEDDKVDFLHIASLGHLSAFFKKYHHRHSFWMNYRRKTPDGFHMADMEVFPAEDYSDDNQSLYLTIKDVSAAENSHLTVYDEYQALCENYVMIGNLNMKTQELAVFRSPAAFYKKPFFIESGVYPYEQVARQLWTNLVMKDDKALLRRITDIRFIQEQLQKSAVFTCDYRVVIKGEVHYHRIKYALIEKDTQKLNAVVGISDVTNEKRMEYDLYRGAKHALIIDNDPENRAQLEALLSDEYQVTCAGSSREALDVLEEEHEEIAVIIADIHMPLLDGYELLRILHSNRSYRSIPVMIATGPENTDEQEKCLQLGAADLIRKPYNPVVVKRRIGFMVKYREAANMLRMVETDQLTGLYSKEFFYRHVEEILRTHPNEKYAIMVSDVVGLRSYNDRYGVEAGDNLLRKIAERGKRMIPGTVVMGRIESGLFGALISSSAYDDWSKTGILRTLSDSGVELHLDHTVIKTGIYFIDEELPVSIMCDRAKMSLETIKGVFGRSVAIYDDALRNRLNRRQILLESAEAGLRERQFHIYYQPKHSLATDRAAGAEALVRWFHPTLGFVTPGDFIPLFEQNGFIQQLDEYVFHQVCDDILRWKAEGKPLVPISLNLSRLNIENDDLPDIIISYVKKLGIDPQLIHLEVTESAYVDNMAKMTAAVKKLHDHGFIIELDDFGAGYSSLTTLNNIELDILKLDMSIIRRDEPGSPRNVLELCMQLARIIGVKTLVEGVETQAQVERLRSLGCDFVQGYFYSKPLPVDEFEAYMTREHNAICAGG